VKIFLRATVSITSKLQLKSLAMHKEPLLVDENYLINTVGEI
jgi:hypothetical protein